MGEFPLQTFIFLQKLKNTYSQKQIVIKMIKGCNLIQNLFARRLVLWAQGNQNDVGILDSRQPAIVPGRAACQNLLWSEKPEGREQVSREYLRSRAIARLRQLIRQGGRPARDAQHRFAGRQNLTALPPYQRQFG